MNKNKRIVFMGTPVFAAEILSFLVKKQYNVVLVVSQPDRKIGRKQIVTPTPVKMVALENELEVFQPEKIKVDFQAVIDSKPDLIITAAYGQIIPSELLKLPTIDAINIHGSLLPKYRGGAPIHYSVLNGDKETGITIMQMVDKMDAGDIIFQRSFPIAENDTTEIVHDRMIEEAKTLLDEKLPDILAGNYDYIAQDESLVSYSPNITREQEQIDWDRKVQDVHNQIRGLSSWPGAYSTLNEQRVKIYKSEVTDIKSNGDVGKIIGFDDESFYVNTLDFQLRVIEVQVASKKRMLVKDYLKGKGRDEINGKSFKS